MNLDLEAIHSAIVDRLPAHARWAVKGTWLDYDFSAGRLELRPLSKDSVALEFLRAAWLDLLIFGDYDFAEGGGANPFLGIHRVDGRVLGLDVERNGEATFLINSSIHHFIHSF